MKRIQLFFQSPISEEQKKDKLVKHLFNGILKELAEKDFKTASPRIFLIYAHEGKQSALAADAKIARTLITWLHGILGLNLYSDRSKTGNRSDAYDELAETDILWSQLCLLPNREKPIDYVILCGSALLGSYAKPQTIFVDYYGELIDALNGLGRQFESLQDRHRALTNIVDGYTKTQKNDFHQAMTELAFLQIRRVQKPNSQPSIVPFLLNDESTAALPDFIKGQEVRIEEAKWLEHGYWEEKETFKSQGLHIAFFKLLMRLHARDEEKREHIQKYQKIYENTIKLIQKNEISKDKIDEMLHDAKASKQEETKIQMSEFDRLFNKGISKSLSI